MKILMKFTSEIILTELQNNIYLIEKSPKTENQIFITVLSIKDIEPTKIWNSSSSDFYLLSCYMIQSPREYRTRLIPQQKLRRHRPVSNKFCEPCVLYVSTTKSWFIERNIMICNNRNRIIKINAVPYEDQIKYDFLSWAGAPTSLATASPSAVLDLAGYFLREAHRSYTAAVVPLRIRC